MADKRAYFKVDVGYFTNPKVAGILGESPTAVILHLESIAYASQHLTDGKVPQRLVMRLVGATDDDARMLLDAGVWLTTDTPGQIEVKDYLEHQRSAAEVKKLSDAGRKAAASRWKSDSDADRTADGSADAVRNPMPREKEREREKTAASAAADEAFEAWYAIYPRKAGKGAAGRAFRGALKKTTAENLTASLVKQLPWFASQDKPDGDFRPYAATWLNGERWADEVSAAVPVDGPRDQWARAIVVGGDQ